LTRENDCRARLFLGRSNYRTWQNYSPFVDDDPRWASGYSCEKIAWFSEDEVSRITMWGKFVIGRRCLEEINCELRTLMAR